MVEWDDDVKKYCNDIYEHSDNIDNADSILESILNKTLKLTNSSFSSNDSLYQAVFRLNKMYNNTQSCLENKDENIKTYTDSLELIVADIKYDKKLANEGDLDLTEEVKFPAAEEAPQNDSPISKQEQAIEILNATTVNYLSKEEWSSIFQAVDNHDPSLKQKLIAGAVASQAKKPRTSIDNASSSQVTDIAKEREIY